MICLFIIFIHSHPNIHDETVLKKTMKTSFTLFQFKKKWYEYQFIFKNQKDIKSSSRYKCTLNPFTFHNTLLVATLFIAFCLTLQLRVFSKNLSLFYKYFLLDNMTNLCALYNLIKFMLLKKCLEYLICISFVAVILKYLNIPAFCSNAHGAFGLVLRHYTVKNKLLGPSMRHCSYLNITQLSKHTSQTKLLRLYYLFLTANYSSITLKQKCTMYSTSTCFIMQLFYTCYIK